MKKFLACACVIALVGGVAFDASAMTKAAAKKACKHVPKKSRKACVKEKMAS